MRAHRLEGITCDPFEGRIKDNINRGGEKIGAEEIEALVGTHPDVADVRVVAMPDPGIWRESMCLPHRARRPAGTNPKGTG